MGPSGLYLLDLKASYWQVELDEKSKPLNCFHSWTFQILWMQKDAI